MKAYNDFTGFAAPADTVVTRDRHAPFAPQSTDAAREIHNARGLVIALMMSAGCWGVIALALFT